MRISWQNLCIPDIPSPLFLTLFVNSVCNLRCEHCFYWKNLEQKGKDDLTLEEIKSLSQELSRIENLYLSGGEPFLRQDFAEICRSFIRNNQVEQIYVPSNAYYTEKIVRSIRDVLKENELKLFVLEISLDGMPGFHNRFRGSEHSFQNAMETYDALVELQKTDPRLKIHAASTATADNIEEIRELTSFLYERCPAMDHHNIAMVRGERRNSSVLDPYIEAYEELYLYTKQLWSPREKGRMGSIVEPMLQWAKARTVREQRQVIPCRAGILNAVVYSNGDVSVCEMLRPLGNLRQMCFQEIWHSQEADSLRCSIRKKSCYCTHSIFLWPSITFQPLQLIKAMLQAKVWKKSVSPTPSSIINSCKEKF